MYWSADGMMMVAKAVTTGHHWGSFQSVQKSQSPANSSRVISAAPATTKIAVIQKTASQERSIHWYFALSRSRNASLRCLSAAAAAAIDGAVAMLPLARSSGQECQNSRRALAPRLTGGSRMRRQFLHGARLLFNLEQVQDRLAPDREHTARQPAINHKG